MIVFASSGKEGIRNTAALPNSVLCPGCQTVPVNGFQLFPLSTELLDSATKIRKAKISGICCNDRLLNPNTQKPFTIDNTAASQGGERMHSTSRAEMSHRMGHWTEDETKFVNFLVHAFENGCLPLANGVRLHEFLCSMLLCKTSRLTKKMRNARLSTKMYQLKVTSDPALDCNMLSTLQEKFLRSVQDEATKLELRFVMEKTWRQMLYNLCVQVGYASMDATGYLSNKRGGIFLSKRGVMDETDYALTGIMLPSPKSDSSKTFISCSDCDDTIHQNNYSMLAGHGHQPTNSLEEFSNIFDELLCPQKGATDQANRMMASTEMKRVGSILLQEVLKYLETKNLPFEHIDIWFPFAVPKSNQVLEKETTLVHSGYATRHDLHPVLLSQLQEYGGYSSQFSVSLGVGLPGRVFQSRTPLWICRLDEAELHIFERTMGAKAFGIKTGVGFPLCLGGDTVSDTIVIAMYSIFDLRQDLINLQLWWTDLVTLLEGCSKVWKVTVEATDLEGSSATVSPDESISPHQMEIEQVSVASSTNNFPSHLQLPPLNSTHEQCQTNRHTNIPFIPSSSTNGIANGMTTARQEELRIASLLHQYEEESSKTQDDSTTFHSSSTTTESSSRFIGAATSWHSRHPRALAIPMEENASSFGSQVSSLCSILLSKPEHRTMKEKKLIEVLRHSYHGYLRGGLRSKSDLVHLLVKEWTLWNNNHPHPHLPVSKQSLPVSSFPSSS
jgi:hypothetical protein